MGGGWVGGWLHWVGGRDWRTSGGKYVEIHRYVGYAIIQKKFIRAHGVVVSHPLSMREALGSIPSVSTFMSYSRQGTPGSARAGSRSPGVGSQILLEGEGERWSEGDNAA